MDGTLQVSWSRQAKQLRGSSRGILYGQSVDTLSSAEGQLIVLQVFGPSTDYRDVRKAAYQEYLVTTDFNVARLPTSVSTSTGAAIGVAFVSAFVALGISLGLNFTTVQRGPRGPDLLDVLGKINRDDVPEDVQEEIFEGIEHEERPHAGDWFAIWGGERIQSLHNILLIMQRLQALGWRPYSSQSLSD